MGSGSKAARRSDGEGSIQQIGSQFRGRLTLTEEQQSLLGRKQNRFFGPVMKSRREAIPAARLKLNRLLESAKRESAASPSFTTLARKSLDARLAKGLSPTTASLYEIILRTRIVDDPIGDLPLDQINAEVVQAWINRQTGVTSTVQRAASFLMSTLKSLGVKDLDVAVPRDREQTIVVLSPAEQDGLLALPMPPEVRMAALLGLRLGLRRGEMCGLRHEDRDDDGVSIERSLAQVRGQLIIKPPKSARGYRWLPLPPELEAQIGPPLTGYVLADDLEGEDRPLSPLALQARWKKALKDTPFSHITLHDLRGSYGMLLLERGADLRTVSELTGHDPAILARIYARSRRDLKREAIRRAFNMDEGAAKGSSVSRGT